MQAGFAEIDITPPIGTLKIGWLIRIPGEKVLDPLFARAAVFQNGKQRVGVISTDLLSIRWTTVQQIRAGIERKHGFPGANVMVAATHNHSGPTVAHVGDVPRDEAYVEELIERCVEVFGVALQTTQKAKVGFGRAFEFGVAFNRRIVMRDGTVQTHARFSDPNALCYEGPIDPEVAVLAAQGSDGRLLGCLVNFACHPTHHSIGDVAFAGIPAEFFVEHGLRIKEATAPRKTMIVAQANGTVGYVPTQLAFLRGGYETTFAPSSRLAPEAGDLLADEAIRLVRGSWKTGPATT